MTLDLDALDAAEKWLAAEPPFDAGWKDHGATLAWQTRHAQWMQHGPTAAHRLIARLLVAEAEVERLRAALRTIAPAEAGWRAAAGAQQKVAQQLLRHAQSKTTTDIYTHVSAAQEREAVGMLERAMTGAVTGTLTEPETSVATSGQE